MSNSTDDGCALLRDIVAHPLTVPLNVVFLLVALSVTVSSVDLFGMLLQTVTVPVRGLSKDKEQRSIAVHCASAATDTRRELLCLWYHMDCAHSAAFVSLRLR